MTSENSGEIPAILEAGRTHLQEASARYERAMSAEEYWWLGAGLAAVTLAELSERTFAVGRIEQLLERMGYKGVKGDWLQRLVEELAELNAEGLIWPIYQRSESGAIEPTGVAVHPDFGPEAGWFLALAHIGVALALHRGDEASVGRLSPVIADLVQHGLTPEGEATILAALQPATD
jgi:hypothetical protein